MDNKGHTKDQYSVREFKLQRKLGELEAVISGLRERIKTLEKNETLYHGILESQDELICRFSPDGTISFANRAFRDLFSQKKQADILGSNFIDVVPVEERKRVKEVIAPLGTENVKGAVEHWFVLPDGEKRWERWIISAIVVDGKFSQLQAVGRDTTERVRTEEVLYQSEQRVKALLDAPTDSALLMDTNWKVLAINRLGAMRFDKSVDDLIGEDIIQYLSKEVYGYRKLYFDKVERTGQPLSFKDEREGRLMESHVYPLFDSNGKVNRFAIFTRDITEKEKAFRALEGKQRELNLQTKNLEQTNIALEVLLKKREKDKAELEEKVLFNVKEIVTPFMEKLLESGLNDTQRTYANIVLDNINGIIAPFSRRLAFEHSGFTPMEVQVANLIKQGNTKKEIAEIFNLSVRTIEYHSSNIRKKLGIRNVKVSLKTHLLNLQ